MQNLEKFNNADFDRGAPKGKELLWILFRSFFFEFSVLPLSSIRRKILNFFGARLATKVTIKPQVKITFPWKLSVGENTWLGEEAWLINLANITIGRNCVISQRAMLCTGSHNWKKESFDLITKPIILEDGVWIERSIYDRPFNRGEFEDWYDCPSGKLTVGETYIDDHNYTASNGLVTKSERTLWYYIGVNTDGDKFVGYQDVMFDSELE